MRTAVFQKYTKKGYYRFEFDKLNAINAQHNERLEIYYENRIYRLVGNRPGVSALKWDIAANVVWKEREEISKLSTYFSFV